MSEEMEWRLFQCSGTEEDTCGFKLIHEVPKGASWERSCDVDWCPHCGTYLSFLGYWSDIKVLTGDGQPV